MGNYESRIPKSIFSNAIGETNNKNNVSSNEIVGKAIQTGKQQIQLMEKKISLFEKRINGCEKNAKLFIKQKNRTRAMHELRKKKIYERQIEKWNGIIMNIESQNIMLDNTTINKSVVGNMKTAKTAMNNIQKDVNIDNVTDLMEDIQDLNADVNEITDLLSETTGLQGDIDDDELLNELDDFGNDDENYRNIKTNTTENKDIDILNTLPDVPNTILEVEKDTNKLTQEENVLKELESLMS